MIKAFIGHSFEKRDEHVVRAFLEYFDSLCKTMEFIWDHAKEADIKTLSEKVREKMEGKNLFVGILTAKHYEVPLDKVRRGKIRKKCFNFDEADLLVGFSDWIFQESGYALGKPMKVLFLVEDAVNKPIGLHGDAEIIPFSHKNIPGSFPNLNTALGNYSNELKGISSDKKDGIASQDRKTTASDSSTEDKPSDEIKLIKKLIDAVRANDNANIEIAEKAYIESRSKSAETKVEAEAFVLWVKSTFGNHNVLGELISLRDAHPSHCKVRKYLGEVYEKFNDFENAAAEFDHEVLTAVDDKAKIMASGRATLARLKSGKDKNESLFAGLLEFLKKSDLSKFDRYLVFKNLSDIAGELKQWELYFCFGERTLSLYPADNSFRFDLAYRYEKEEKYALSLHHYKLLCDLNPNASNYNNLGVAYDRLKIESKANTSYRFAVELNGTLAMANLAKSYISAGFLKDADALLSKAVSFGNYDKEHVGEAMTQLENKRGEDVKKEEKALEGIEKEKDFYSSYAEAYAMSCNIEQSIVGNWETPHGIISLVVSGSKVTGKSELLEPATGSNSRKITTIFTGQLHNKSLKYEIKLSKQRLPQDTLLGAPVDELIIGLGIIDSESITVKETRQNGASFFLFKKLR